MDDLNRKLAIASLFENSGFKLFMEELANLKDTNANQLDKLLKDKVPQGKLEELNFILGEKNGLMRAFLVLEAFKEELEERTSPKAKA